ncbi:MAG: archaellin/type IV pilin N-terminal domain-containing protein [Candidatus Thorarchaeota archaeon]|jgi:flagellin-like protein
MRTKKLNKLLKRRSGLSEVVVTLILVAFAVLLALTATAFINGVVRSRMKSTGQEDVRFYKKHAWVEPLSNGTDRAVVAFKLYNIGGKSISVEIIDVRGLEVDWSIVYFHVVNKTSENTLLYSDLSYFPWASISGSTVDIGGYNYTQSTGSIYVESGFTTIVYIKMPEMIYKDNIGQPMALAIGTANVNYITETIIESAD